MFCSLFLDPKVSDDIYAPRGGLKTHFYKFNTPSVVVFLKISIWAGIHQSRLTSFIFPTDMLS